MSWLISAALMRDYENSRSSQGPVEAFSAGTCSDGARSALSSGTPTPRAFLPPDRMTDFSRPSRFGMTFGPLTDDLGEELLTWFLGASRARTSVSPEKVTGSKASGPACGQKWRGSLAKYDPDSRSWRTAQPSLLGDSDEFSETWPRWGTTVAGELYLLPMPARLTCAKESGLLPTPNASDNRDRGSLANPSVQRRIAIGKQIGLSVLFAKEPCPLCVEGTMGWPKNWTALRSSVALPQSETARFQLQWPLPGAA